MASRSAHRRVLRWTAPLAIAAVLAGAVGLATRSEGAAPSLPPRTAEQLLVDLARAQVPGLSGTVVETARLGLPSLPTAGGADTSLAGLAAGSHTIRVWYAGQDRVRVAVSGPLAESDVIRTGRDAWIWSSRDNTATHLRLPTDGHGRTAGRPEGGVLPTTPQAAARQVLDAITPTTTVRVGRTDRVAGRPVYELRLAPNDARSLVDSVTVAVDSQTSIPLRIQVFARAAASPAFEVGFTQVQLRAPGDDVFRFTPPPGAKVTERRVDATATGTPGHDGAAADAATSPQRDRAQAASEVRPAVIGSGWTAVLVVRGVPGGTAGGQAAGGAAGGTAAGSTAAAGDATARALLQAATPVSGAFGRGHLLRTALVSVLLTDDGRLYAGAVTPDALTAAAALPASAARPLGPQGSTR